MNHIARIRNIPCNPIFGSRKATIAVTANMYNKSSMFVYYYIAYISK